MFSFRSIHTRTLLATPRTKLSLIATQYVPGNAWNECTYVNCQQETDVSSLVLNLEDYWCCCGSMWLGRLLVISGRACEAGVCVCVSVTPLSVIPLVYGYKIRYESKANVGF